MPSIRVSSEINKWDKKGPCGRLANKTKIFIGPIILCLIFATVLSPAINLSINEVQAADEIGWYVHTVDDGNIDIGSTSLAFDPSGNPAISYHDYTDGALKYAHWNGQSWDVQTVDAGYTGQYASLVFDTSGNPAIAYRSYYLVYVLKYAHWNGSSWDIQTVDTGQIQYVSLAIDPSDNPGIVYSALSTNELKYAHWDGLSWDIQTVASKESSATYYGSLAFDEEGNPAIASSGSCVQYAYWNGTAWDIHNISSGSSINGSYTSIALDSSGNPFISYYDCLGSYHLKCLHWDGSAWDIQTVDDEPNSDGYYISSLTLDTSGNPAIAYNGNDGLKYATWDGTSWHTQIVDSGNTGFYASLKFDNLGNPAISYTPGAGHTAEGKLRFASVIPMGSPNQPDNLSPYDGVTNTGLPVTLKSSNFSDPTIGDTHIASQWQVTYVPGDYSNPIFDSGRDTINLTQITLPTQTFTYAVTYFWHVRYQDSYGSWSSYSSDFCFTTTNYTQPSADFSAELTTINEEGTVVFTDLSVGYITAWQWDLGDGTLVEWALDTRPENGKLSHVYTNKGNYTVTLEVRTLGGSDIEIKEDYISVDKVLIEEDINTGNRRVETEDKQIIIEFPEDILSGTMIVVVKVESEAPAAHGELKAGNTYFTVNIFDAEGNLVETLAKDVIITVRYSDVDLSAAGGDPLRLTLARYDEESEDWITVPTSLDATDKTLNATTNQFSKWMIMAEEPHSSSQAWIWIVTISAGIVFTLIAGGVIWTRFIRKRTI